MALLTPRRRGQACLAAALWFWLAAPVEGQRATAEDQIKAVFLFNFAKYVDWPSPPTPSAPIRLCVPANPGFLAVVQQAVAGEFVSGRPVEAAGLDGLDAARACQILYVGNASTADASAWLTAVRGRQTLTVGDGRLAEGLVIAFINDQNRIRFDISRVAEHRQRLAISSRLLGLARRVVEP
jgi:hypothetical protein